MAHSTPRTFLAALLLFPCTYAAAQAPYLEVTNRTGTSLLPWQQIGPIGELYATVLDTSAGSTPLFGAQFDLAFGPSALILRVGTLTGGIQSDFVPLPAGLPVGTVGFLQYGAFDVASGLGSMTSSNVDSFCVRPGTGAIEFAFNGPIALSGVYDATVPRRLQALPPRTRTVTPLPPEAVPALGYDNAQPMHPSGSRFQFALRASDLAANGLPERLVAVRWRPLFGNVAPESFADFELLAGHTAATPNYAIDPWSALPSAPLSGISSTFAQNPTAPMQSVFHGAYAVLPQALRPDGYLPYPQPTTTFEYDGESTLLLETRCAPTGAGGTPQNFHLKHVMVPSAPTPFASVQAVAGQGGQPSPLAPLAATDGVGGCWLPELQLEFEQTTSQVITGYATSYQASPDYLAPIVQAYTPPGTSVSLEFRGMAPFGATTAWSSSPDVADGLGHLQLRVTMEADPVTGAVPWVTAVHVPVQ